MFCLHVVLVDINFIQTLQQKKRADLTPRTRRQPYLLIDRSTPVPAAAVVVSVLVMVMVVEAAMMVVMVVSSDVSCTVWHPGSLSQTQLATASTFGELLPRVEWETVDSGLEHGNLGLSGSDDHFQLSAVTHALSRTSS